MDAYIKNEPKENQKRIKRELKTDTCPVSDTNGEILSSNNQRFMILARILNHIIRTP